MTEIVSAGNVSAFLPQFFPSVWRTEYGVYGMDFAADVALGFVSRADGSYEYLLNDGYARIELSGTDVLAAALSNLEQIGGASLKIARPDDSAVAWIEAEDNFSSVRLLLPSVQSVLLQELGPKFLFTIASRDQCFCWTTDAPISLHQKYVQEAIEDFESEDYNLSPLVLVYTQQWPCRAYVGPPNQ